MNILKELSSDELVKQEYLAREKALLDEYSKKVYFQLKMEDEVKKAKKEALKEGLEQGIERGIEQGEKRAQIAFVESLIQLGTDLSFIVQATKLSLEEVTEIYNQMVDKSH